MDYDFSKARKEGRICKACGRIISMSRWNEYKGDTNICGICFHKGFNESDIPGRSPIEDNKEWSDLFEDDEE